MWSRDEQETEQDEHASARTHCTDACATSENNTVLVDPRSKKQRSLPAW